MIAHGQVFAMLRRMDPEPQVDALERIVVGAVGLTTHALAEAAPDIDLTFPQWRAILILGEGADGARVGAVAARVGVTLPATSRLLRRLERRGLVSLATDEADRRATRARLTERGRGVRAAILAYRRASLRAMAAHIAAPEDAGPAETIVRLAAAFEAFA